MNSGALAKSLAKSLYRSVSVWGLTTLLLSWATISYARPTSHSSSALSAGCQASAKGISASNWQISAPQEPNWTKPDEIVQIGLRNSQGAVVRYDRVVARVLAPDGSLAAAYPSLSSDRYTYLTYPLDFSQAQPTQAGTYTVILEVNGQSVLCDRFVVAQPSLIDTAFDSDLTGKKLELDLETFLNSDDSASESLLFASNANKTHNRLFSLSSPSNPFSDNFDLDTDNLLSPDPNPIVKETASSNNSSSNPKICLWTLDRSSHSSKPDNTQEQQSTQDLEDFMESMGCTSSSFPIGRTGKNWSIAGDNVDFFFYPPELNSGLDTRVAKVVEPSLVLALLFLTTLTWMEKRK
ncbi:MAG: hypothetical protein MUD14_12140 [Hydrococcus sp. Prado102]|jgi:hypothetical protein|nr:hypothetical protein [Hydrococcus sp. Prado102]